jgi:hypothetical protein
MSARRPIPGRDHPVEGLSDDGVIRRSDYRREQLGLLVIGASRDILKRRLSHRIPPTTGLLKPWNCASATAALSRSPGTDSPHQAGLFRIHLEGLAKFNAGNGTDEMIRVAWLLRLPPSRTHLQLTGRVSAGPLDVMPCGKVTHAEASEMP